MISGWRQEEWSLDRSAGVVECSSSLQLHASAEERHSSPQTITKIIQAHLLPHHLPSPSTMHDHPPTSARSLPLSGRTCLYLACLPPLPPHKACLALATPPLHIAPLPLPLPYPLPPSLGLCPAPAYLPPPPPPPPHCTTTSLPLSLSHTRTRTCHTCFAFLHHFSCALFFYMHTLHFSHCCHWHGTF